MRHCWKEFWKTVGLVSDSSNKVMAGVSDPADNNTLIKLIKQKTFLLFFFFLHTILSYDSSHDISFPLIHQKWLGCGYL